MHLSKKIPHKSEFVCYNAKNDKGEDKFMNDNNFTQTAKIPQGCKSSAGTSGYMHLAPGGERIMALLSIAGWITFLLKFAVI